MSAENAMVFDQVVVGAGIAGASVAWQLAAHGRVAVLERESQPGYHATGRSAAMFMESHGTPMVRALTWANRAFYAQPPPRFAEHPLLSPRGCMHVAQPGQEHALEAAFEALRAASSPVTRLMVGEVLARCPLLREEHVAGALSKPDAIGPADARFPMGRRAGRLRHPDRNGCLRGRGDADPRLALPVPDHLARFGVRAEAPSPQRLRDAGPTP